MRRHLKQLKKYSNTIGTLLICLFMTSALAACSDSGKKPGSTIPVAPKQAQKPVSQPTPTAVETQPAETEYTYSPAGRRDPFAPIMEKEEKTAKAGERPPLERYNLFDFKMAGVVWGGFGYNAMLEGPDGKGYFVRVGTVIGPNKGVVKKITQTKMIVEEKFKNFSGEIERKEIVIELRKKQEGMQ